MRESITRTVSIKAPAQRVLASLAQIENLPDWVRSVTHPRRRSTDASAGAQETPSCTAGCWPLEVIVDAQRGTVDYVWAACGETEVAAARVIPLDGEAQVILTLFEPAGACSDCSSLAERSAAVEADLLMLKGLLEVRSAGPAETWH